MKHKVRIWKDIVLDIAACLIFPAMIGTAIFLIAKGRTPKWETGLYVLFTALVLPGIVKLMRGLPKKLRQAIGGDLPLDRKI
jgi:hypothetical protein